MGHISGNAINSISDKLTKLQRDTCLAEMNTKDKQAVHITTYQLRQWSLNWGSRGIKCPLQLQNIVRSKSDCIVI